MKFLTALDLRAFKPDEWVLLSVLRYVDDMVGEITVPRGFITDLASIPKALRAVFDVNGLSRKAAVVHDFLYCSQGLEGELTRAQCDRIFRDALALLGVGAAQRYTLWAGVRAGGWLHWRRRSDGLHNNFDFVPDNFWSTST